jgi:Zn-dependent peptidase ImmA (M78 family)/transcriptional regulator with XRE-family HTH domain
MEQNNVNPQMITLARDYRGLSQNELADKMGVTQGFLSKVEKGILSVSDDVLETFSNILKLPIGFFLRRGDTFPPNLYYRKKAKTSQRILTKAEAEMNIHRLNIHELLKSVDLQVKPLPLFDIEEHGTPQIIAKKLRQFWNIPSGPIINLFELIERHGVIIIFCDFESTDIDGRSMYTDNKQPIVYINKNLPVDRQRFTLAHELGHLVMHIGFSVPENRDVEKEAQKFSSEFLIPENDLRKQVLGHLAMSSLADLKRYWKISMQAILYKAFDSKIITANNHKSLIIQISRFGMRLKEPAELEPKKENPILLKTLIKLHLNDLEFSEDELAGIIKFNLDEMKNKYFEIEPPKKLRVVI